MQQNKHKQDNIITYVYKKNGFHPIVPHSDTFLFEVHSYHTFCTHIYNPNVHIKNKYIYKKRGKIHTNK